MASAAEKISTISVTKLHPVIGAEIGGVDLRYPLDGETIGRIKDAWHKHTVLVFRGQDLSEEDQRRFASCGRSATTAAIAAGNSPYALMMRSGRNVAIGTSV